MFGLDARELLILAFVLVLFFGTKKIPELARNVGEAVRHVRGGFSDEKDGDTADKKRNKIA